MIIFKLFSGDKSKVYKLKELYSLNKTLLLATKIKTWDHALEVDDSLNHS